MTHSLITPALSQSYSSSPHSNTIPLSTSLSDTIEDVFNPHPATTYASQDINKEYMRIWTLPNLTNPEVLQLLKVFPVFITSHATPSHALSPHMAINRQVQFQLVLACPVLTPKLANPYQLLALHPIDMGSPPHTIFPNQKLGISVAILYI